MKTTLFSGIRYAYSVWQSGLYREILIFKESVQLLIEKKILKTEIKTSGADSNYISYLLLVKKFHIRKKKLFRI